MKKILILGSLLLLPLFIFANVNFTLSHKKIYQGEKVSFAIEATGNDIEFPKIEKIGDYLVKVTGNSTNIVYENGNLKTTKIREYSFYPEKNVTIPAFKVLVDKKEYKTAPISIEVLKGDATSAPLQGDAKLSLQLNKKEAYVGEPVMLTITLTINAKSNIAKAELEKPNFPNFWVKLLNGGTKRQVGDSIIQEYAILIFPQKSGKLQIGPVVAGIAKPQKLGAGFEDEFFSSFFQTLNWEKIVSNTILLNVKPLPDNLELYGDFSINASVDKTKVHANKPVNLTIRVQGFGNIDDIKKFELDIPNAIIYSDEPKVKSYIQNGKYGGVFTQKIAIVADRNYTIPSISLKYFSAKEQKIKTVKTKPIDIEVVGAPKVAAVKIERATPKVATTPLNTPTKEKIVIKEKESPLNYLYLLLSFLAGVAVASAVFLFKKRKKEPKELEISKAIKRAKDEKELFKLLLPYQKEHKFIADILEKLEANIYKGANNSINKKELIEFFEDRDIE